MRIWRMVSISALLPGMAAFLALPAAAPAAAGADPNMIYWGDNSASRIAEANLDGSGNGSNLNTSGATVANPTGTAIDPADNKIFWTNAQGGHFTISEANLDGTGGGADLNTTGATAPNVPVAVAIDPATNKIYWANVGDNKISFANLDNTGGGGDLNTTGVTPNNPQGLAIDAADNKLFWTNASGNSISFANLDNTGGGGTLTITGTATINNPVGLAVDPVARKIYWANAVATGKISEANLDGSNSQDLSTTGATAPNFPSGVAIDPAANKIYWASKGASKISEANLDGTGSGHDLSTSGASASNPNFPALLEMPLGTGAPQITGGSSSGSTLSCSQGSWASDLLGALLYRAPRTYSYQWTFNGADIVGATSNTYKAPSGGSYACRVTATNQAGPTSQASAPFTVTGGGTPPITKISLTKVSQSHRRWREGSGLPHIASVRPPIGTTFRFTLNEAAKVRLVFKQRLPGRRVNGRCVAPTATNHSKPKCTRLVGRGSLSVSVKTGSHRLRFQGRLSKHKRLPVGRYIVLITATNAAGQHATAKLTFTIVK